MAHSPNTNLWDPRAGIRFSPQPHPQPLYPSLNLSRSLSGSSTPESQSLTPEESFLDDDEEFERAASEWFDKQDALALARSSSESNSKVSHILGATASPKPQNSENGDSKPAKTTKDVKEDVKLEWAHPPSTSLDYAISIKLYNAARESKPNLPESFWSYNLYRHVQPDGTEKKVTIHYCRSKHTTEQTCQKYFQGEDTLGFDMEWHSFATSSSGPRKNVSLVQLASPSHIALFHIALFKDDDFVAPTFKKIMENPEVRKCGVNISGDCTRLKKYLGVYPQGVFELSHLYKLIKHSRDGQLKRINKTVVSMATQVQEVMGLPLYKDQSVRSSNWSWELSPQQILYSASDAYVGVQLYHVLNEQRTKLEPCPPLPHHHELGLPIRVAEAIVKEEDIESEEDMDEVTELIFETTTTTSTTIKRKRTTDNPPKPRPTRRDRHLAAADEKVQLYRDNARTTKVIRVPPNALLSYYLWHDNQYLKPEDIAKLLRDPPLHTNTVVGYIMDAIAVENLPYEKQRFRGEVLVHLALDSPISSKYRKMIDEALTDDT